jgi:hypothetical protein
MKKISYLLSGLIITAMPLIKFPQTEISNGLMKATIYLPDEKEGYYRSTRFDWSGNMPSLQYKGHEFFGQWFSKYSPEIHDVIMGPVEEFVSPDFADAKPGESFLKIGVGILAKPDDKPYAFARLYDVLNHGKWSVKEKSDQIHFTHELKDKSFSYKYEKNITFVKDKPVMILSHTLKNTGSKSIETSCYDHNFFMMDKQPVGPGYVVRLPFDIKGQGQGIGVLAELKANEIVFLRDLKGDETVFCGGLEGFGPKAEDYDIRIENRIAGTGVRITCDQPILKLNFWCCATTVCPEPYIKIAAAPGKEFKWTITYEFYTL